jgi:predicted DsbA family dithiol-disulfide isomerase
MNAPAEALPEDRAAPFLCAFRAAVLIAAAASSALYVQYSSPADAAFCGLDSGCEAVRRAGLTSLGSPLFSIPLAGLAAYAALYAMSLLYPKGGATTAFAVIGAVIGVGLVATQAFVVQAWFHHRSGKGRDPLRLFGWTSLFVAAVAAPFAWSKVKPPLPVPAVIRELYVPGKVNIVEFADFECPHCRVLHPRLKRVLAEETGGRVHFVRGHVPLPSHTEARPAARAMVCAEEQGKDEALADRLVEIELAPGAIREAALSAGVDPAQLEACLRSKRPDARIEADTKRLKAAGMSGLPTTYVGEQRLLGGNISEAKLRDSIERAARGEDGASLGQGNIGGPLFVTLLVVLLAALAWFGREPHVTLPHEPSD